MGTSNKPDLDAIAIRLRTRNTAIERALETMLARAGLRRAAIAKLASLAERAEPARIAETRRRLEAEPGAAGVSWEALCRPSLSSISGDGRSLRRA
jgi:cobalamin biosynthesis protein CbiG